MYFVGVNLDENHKVALRSIQLTLNGIGFEDLVDFLDLMKNLSSNKSKGGRGNCNELPLIRIDTLRSVLMSRTSRKLCEKVEDLIPESF